MTIQLSDGQLDRIRAIQAGVRAMLAERGGLDGPAGAGPSRYWTDFCSFFEYLIDLPARHFARLRLHTYHLTGDNYQTYYLGNRRAFLDYWGHHLAVEDLPPRLVIEEPPGGIGFRLDDGRFVSQDVARFQRAIATLHRHGALGFLDRDAAGGARPTVLEIGAGYGGLPLHFGRFAPGCRYVVVDLPETLLYSAAYLALEAPDRNVYLYDPATFDPAMLLDERSPVDVFLLPDYRLGALEPLDLAFDLVLNIASMQEMRAEQVERYLGWIGRTCRGVFYSFNRDRQDRNDELGGLFAMLRARFDVTEVPSPWDRPPGLKRRLRSRTRSALRGAAALVGLAEPLAADPAPAAPYVEHLCRVRALAPGPDRG